MHRLCHQIQTQLCILDIDALMYTFHSIAGDVGEDDGGLAGVAGRAAALHERHVRQQPGVRQDVHGPRDHAGRRRGRRQVAAVHLLRHLQRHPDLRPEGRVRRQVSGFTTNFCEGHFDLCYHHQLMTSALH